MFSQKKEEETKRQERQFLTFCLNDEYFGMELHQTREILQYTSVTDVPLMPSFLIGVINLRGEVVPVIDLAVRLGRDPVKVHKRTCVVIVELHTYDKHYVLGLLVDSVSEVIGIEEMDIDDAPAFGAKVRADFIVGIAKMNEEFVVLLDAEKTLSPVELAHLVESELQDEESTTPVNEEG